MLFTAHHQLLARNICGYAVERINKRQQNNLVEAVNLISFFFPAFTATMHRPPRTNIQHTLARAVGVSLPAYCLVNWKESMIGVSEIFLH